MKKGIAVSLITVAVVIGMGCCISCFGAKQETVRVGLERQYKGVSSITVENNDIEICVDGGNTYTVSGGMLSSAGGVYYDTGKSFSDLEKATEYMENGIPVMKKDGWAVYFKENTALSSVTVEEVKEDKNVEETKDIQTENADAVVLGGNEISLKTSQGEILLDCKNHITLSSSSNVVDLGQSSYRGIIEIKATAGVLTAVNELTVDEYLYGVVPAEIYSSWGAEALKAQAVAARTYAEYSKGKHSDYDLCDSTHCQMYKGYDIEAQSTNNAVNATSGEMIYYDNKPICAVYFDCSGGHTVSAKSTWGSDIPYLQGVVDEYEVEPKTWTYTYTLEELTKRAEELGFEIGDVVNVSVGEKTDNILVEKINLTGTKGNATVEGVKIKEFFAKDGTNIDGRCFTLQGGNAPVNNVYVSAVDKNREKVELEVITVIDGDGKVTVLDDLNCVVKSAAGEVVISENTGQVVEANSVITLSGKGWGHGVGMSQRGACGLANQGYDYKEILKYYYKGVNIK